MTGDDRVDLLIRRADPARGADPFDPGLLERIVRTGPGSRPNRRRPAILSVVAATVAVTIGAFALAQTLTNHRGGPSPALRSPSSTAPTTATSATSAPCSTSGWKARTLPPGYQPAAPVENRRAGWDGGWETADGSLQIVLEVHCGATLGEGEMARTKPNYRLAGRPARLEPIGEDALWLYWQQAPGIVLVLSTYGPPIPPRSVVFAIAEALTHDPSVTTAPPPGGGCTAELAGFRVNPPPGYRLLSDGPVSGRTDMRALRYERGDALVGIALACPGFVDLTNNGSAVPAPFGQARYQEVGGKLLLAWQAGPQFMVNIIASGGATKTDVLAFVAGARRA